MNIILSSGCLTSHEPGFQTPLGSHREKTLGNEGLAYIETPSMKAHLLLFALPLSQWFLKEQQGQLNRHSLACKKRRSIISSSQENGEV